MISAYCLGYQQFTVVEKHIHEDFESMVEMGFDTVCLSFSESERQYSRRAMKMQVDIARSKGLKVDIVPSRIGGRLAGAP